MRRLAIESTLSSAWRRAISHKATDLAVRYRVRLSRPGAFGSPRGTWLPPGPWLSLRALLAAPWVAMVLVAYYDPGDVVRWFFD